MPESTHGAGPALAAHSNPRQGKTSVRVTGETRSLHEGGKAVPRLLPQATDFLRQPLISVAALIAGGVNQWAQEPSAPSRRSCCAKMEASMSAKFSSPTVPRAAAAYAGQQLGHGSAPGSR